MKNLLITLFSLASIVSYAQGPNSFGGVALRVNDTTTYQTNAAAFHTAGYYDIYFNNQATNDHWDVWNGSNYDHIFSFVPTLGSKYVVDQATTSTAGGTITLDMNSQIQRSHVGSATFSSAKIIALSNTTNSLFFNFYFEVTNVAAEITVPSDWWFSTEDFDGTEWIPPATGKYEFGGSFDDVNNRWYIKVNSTPFQN